MWYRLKVEKLVQLHTSEFFFSLYVSHFVLCDVSLNTISTISMFCDSEVKRLEQH
jgi:hypothetical protein